jgi:hypothetical protein
VPLRQAEGDKPNLLNDGTNLYLRVIEGARGVVHKVWLFRFCGKWTSGISPFPDVGLVEAREKARELRAQVRGELRTWPPNVAGRSAPGTIPRNEKTFEEVAEESHKAHRADWSSPKYALQGKAEMATHASPVIGKLRIGDVDVIAVHRTLDPHWRTRPTILRRVRARIEAVLGYAMAAKYRPVEAKAAAWHARPARPQRGNDRDLRRYACSFWHSIRIAAARKGRPSANGQSERARCPSSKRGKDRGL